VAVSCWVEVAVVSGWLDPARVVLVWASVVEDEGSGVLDVVADPV
jgi:hypothetical protein